MTDELSANQSINQNTFMCSASHVSRTNHSCIMGETRLNVLFIFTIDDIKQFGFKLRLKMPISSVDLQLYDTWVPD